MREAGCEETRRPRDRRRHVGRADWMTAVPGRGAEGEQKGEGGPSLARVSERLAWQSPRSAGPRTRVEDAGTPGFWSGAGIWGHVERAVAAGQAQGPVPAPLFPSKTFRKKFSGFDQRLFCSKVSANCSWLRTPGACAAPSGSASPPGLGASASLHARGRWAPPLLSLCPRACHVRSSGSVLAGVGAWGS